MFQYNREPEGKDKYWELFWPLPRLATLGVDGQYDYARAVLQHLEAVGRCILADSTRGATETAIFHMGLQRIGVASELQCCSLMLSFATTKHERLSTALSGAYALKTVFRCHRIKLSCVCLARALI